jgi:hypothetical protein
MALSPYDPRDEISDALMKQRGASAFDYGLAGLGSAAPAMSPMSGPTLAGLPQTPGGGVPGSGLAAAGPSTVQLPPQRTGTQGAMPMMGGLGMAQAPGLGGMQPMGQQRRRPGMPY